MKECENVKIHLFPIKDKIMQNHIQQIYLDTSVIGGYYDDEFEEDTQILFEKIHLGQFHILYSNVTEDELIGAPESTCVPANYNKAILLTRTGTHSDLF